MLVFAIKVLSQMDSTGDLAGKAEWHNRMPRRVASVLSTSEIPSQQLPLLTQQAVEKIVAALGWPSEYNFPTTRKLGLLPGTTRKVQEPFPGIWDY